MDTNRANFQTGGGFTNVANYPNADSYYGTLDQLGNAAEWVSDRRVAGMQGVIGGDYRTNSDRNFVWADATNRAAFRVATRMVLQGPNRFDAAVGRTFSYRVTPGSEFSEAKFLVYAATNLPADLKINVASGVISGKPAISGTFTNCRVTISMLGGGETNSSTVPLVFEIRPAGANLDMPFLAGQLALANQDLRLAAQEFTNAVNAQPNNLTNRVYRALSSLALLQQNPVGNAVLDKFYVLSSPAPWDAFGDVDSRRYDLAPQAYQNDSFRLKDGAASPTDIIDVLRNVHLPVELAAERDLAQIPLNSTNFMVLIPMGLAGSTAITVDYGDIQMLRALLAAKRAMAYFLSIHNWSMTTNQWGTIVKKSGTDERVTVENIFSTLPLLNLRKAADGPLCRDELILAEARYQDASQFIRNIRPPDELRLFNLNLLEAGEEDSLRNRLSEWKEALDEPAVVQIGQTNSTVNGAVFFTNRGLNLRSMLPTLAANRVREGTFPDPTFGGLFPDLTTSEIEKWLWNQTPKTEGWSYDPSSGWQRVPNGQSFDRYAFGLLRQRPVITSANRLLGQVGKSFSYQMVATNIAANSPIIYGVNPLPGGLIVNSETGLITGTNTMALVTNIVLSVTNLGGVGLRTNAAIILPAFTSSVSVSGFLGDPQFRHVVAVSSNDFGSSLKFSAANPPPGLKFDGASQTFAGTPATNGVYTSRVVMSFQGVAATQSIAFSFPAAAGGGFRTNLGSGLTNLSGIPPGLTYNSKTGVLQGTPRQAGDFTVFAMSNGVQTSNSLSFLPSFPQIASPLVVSVKTNEIFFYQIIPGGFGREWAGFDNFDTSSSTNWAAATNAGKANLVRTNGELHFSPGTTNASYQASHWYWKRIVPSHVSWLAYVDSWVSTNRTPMSTNPAGQYGKAQLLAIQTTNTNANPVSLIPVMENMIRSKLYREPGIFRQEAEVTVGDVPWYAGFSSPLDPADYQSLSLKKGVSLRATNGQLCFSSTGGNSDNQLALVAPNLRLALSRNWSIRLDAWMDTNWSTPFSAIGLTVIKDSPDMQKVTVDAMSAMLSNNVAMKLKRDDGGTNFLTMHFKTNGLEGSSLTNLAAGTWGRLRLRYETNGMKLTAEGNTNGGTNYVVFRQLSLDPAQTNSLGQAWGISGTNARLRLALWGQTHRTNGTGSHLMALDNLEVLIDPPEVSTNLPAEYDWTVCAIGYDQPAGEIISFGWDYEKEEIVELLRTTVADWDLGTQGGFVLVVGGHQQWAGMRTGDVGFDNFALFPWTGEFDFFAPSPPGWLTFHETTGMLSGTAPSDPQTNTVSISVSSEGGTDTRTLEIRVTP